MSDCFDHFGDAMEELYSGRIDEPGEYYARAPQPLPPVEVGKVEIIAETAKAYLLRIPKFNLQHWFPKRHMRLNNDEAIIETWLMRRVLKEQHA